MKKKIRSHIHFYKHWPTSDVVGCIHVPVAVDVDTSIEMAAAARNDEPEIPMQTWVPVIRYERSCLVVTRDDEDACVFVPQIEEAV